jgi:hypothetical protein
MPSRTPYLHFGFRAVHRQEPTYQTALRYSNRNLKFYGRTDKRERLRGVDGRSETYFRLPSRGRCLYAVRNGGLRKLPMFERDHLNDDVLREAEKQGAAQTRSQSHSVLNNKSRQ